MTTQPDQVALTRRELSRQRGRRGFADFRPRIRGGNLGSLPVVIGLVVIWVDLPGAQPALPLREQPREPHAAVRGGRHHRDRRRARAARRRRSTSRSARSAVSPRRSSASGSPSWLAGSWSRSWSRSLAGVAIGLALRPALHPIRRAELHHHARRTARRARPAARVLGATGSINIPFDSPIVQFATAGSCRRGSPTSLAAVGAGGLFVSDRAPPPPPRAAPGCSTRIDRRRRRSGPACSCAADGRSAVWYLADGPRRRRRCSCSSCVLVRARELPAHAHPLGAQRVRGRRLGRGRAPRRHPGRPGLHLGLRALLHLRGRSAASSPRRG